MAIKAPSTGRPWSYHRTPDSGTAVVRCVRTDCERCKRHRANLDRLSAEKRLENHRAQLPNGSTPDGPRIVIAMPVGRPVEKKQVDWSTVDWQEKQLVVEGLSVRIDRTTGKALRDKDGNVVTTTARFRAPGDDKLDKKIVGARLAAGARSKRGKVQGSTSVSSSWAVPSDRDLDLQHIEPGNLLTVTAELHRKIADVKADMHSVHISAVRATQRTKSKRKVARTPEPSRTVRRWLA